ncbi:hypothetical protein CHS0354_023511 [Potamilus streckersoni]|uniref:Histone deacetylase 8 n=1 Tax=Potamilus streckersoni TaxID=2493646 RepID=A0AAE0VJ60_9BIVA|nr:hypothetical protein CHS0354_023511 [Potamilus streckersoni]
MAKALASEKYSFPEDESPEQPRINFSDLRSNVNRKTKLTSKYNNCECDFNYSPVCDQGAFHNSRAKGNDADGSNTDIEKRSDRYSNSNFKTSTDCLSKSTLVVPDSRETTAEKITVCYIYNPDLVERSDELPKIPMRASMVHSLIEAYGLLKHMQVISPSEATLEDMKQFHTEDYLHFLGKIADEDDENFDEESHQYGLGYDCPVYKEVYKLACLVSGATLKAVDILISSEARIVINWFGGWHHAKRDSAAGLCYVNDIVLGIQRLRQRFDRVLYVDLDLHHGDGVEDAFCTTNKVLTVSVHKHSPGFFPGTGSVTDVGVGKGKYYCVNIPLHDGIKDEQFVPLVCRILTHVKDRYKPEVVVCQCGADGIAGDPMESFNLTPVALMKCIYLLLSWNLPIMLLGGGGYNHANTARCWTYITGVVLGRKLACEIPDHKFLMEYGPDYELQIEVGNMKNHNSNEYLQRVYRQVTENISHIV